MAGPAKGGLRGPISLLNVGVVSSRVLSHCSFHHPLALTLSLSLLPSIPLSYLLSIHPSSGPLRNNNSMVSVSLIGTPKA